MPRHDTENPNENPIETPPDEPPPDEPTPDSGSATGPKRADARRNEATLLTAAAEVFATHGVAAPMRTIAAQAGVGVGTI